MLLSEICDLMGLRTFVIEKLEKTTPRRDLPKIWRNPVQHYQQTHSDFWLHTREYMQTYADHANTQAVIHLLEVAGSANEVEAVQWLLKNDELVP